MSNILDKLSEENTTISLQTGPAAISSRGSAVRPGPPIQHLYLAHDVERVHRRYLDLLRTEMSKLGVDDVSPAQVLMLFTIGSDELSVRDLLERGNYLGSNASYNLKRLWEAQYIVREASSRDRRSARIRLTPKGHNLCDTIRKIDRNYQQLLARNDEEARDLETTIRTLRRVEVIFITAMRCGEIVHGDD